MRRNWGVNPEGRRRRRAMYTDAEREESRRSRMGPLYTPRRTAEEDPEIVAGHTGTAEPETENST